MKTGSSDIRADALSTGALLDWEFQRLFEERKGVAMSKIMVTAATAALVVVLALASVASEEMPGADAEALWSYLTKADPYTKWKFWPDHEGMQPGNAPHGPNHKVFVNSLALESPGVPMQSGAIQVKESYSKKEKLKAITVMYKINGYNQEGGDWFWVRYSPAGKVGASGKLKSCIGCHESAAENDYVFVHEIGS
jgi:hypothetical protein